MHRSRMIFVVVLALTLVTASTEAQAASGFANAAFQGQWQAGEAVTPNFWGPIETAKDGQQEPYKEASGGMRLVQYFDKGRMELTNGTVTNGLLATEIITGRIQTGDNSFQNQAPPNISIAGDADNPAPTYAGLAGKGAALLQATPSKPGVPINTVIGADGAVGTTDAVAPDPAMQVGTYDGPTQHNVAAGFADYRAKAGLPTIGYAISEPFRATVKVGGTPKDVMVQVFERRALTYTPSNPDAFKVEMGNIGQHYYTWRYANGAAATPPPAGTGTGTTQVDLASGVAFRYPNGWKINPDPSTGVTLIGPAPTLQLTVQVYDQTGSIDSELSGYVQSVHNLLTGGITSESTRDLTIGGEAGKVYTFSGNRPADKPSSSSGDKIAVSGEVALVYHKGKVYNFTFLVDASTLPNTNDITGILATVTFQS